MFHPSYRGTEKTDIFMESSILRKCDWRPEATVLLPRIPKQVGQCSSFFREMEPIGWKERVRRREGVGEEEEEKY